MRWRRAPFDAVSLAGNADIIPLSALNDFLYCPRRAGLKLIEGLRGTNEHTILGDLAHEHVDTPGYEERAGWELLRALPVFSDTLGLSGKADLVEVRRANFDSQISDSRLQKIGRVIDARPVEYKKGPKRRFDNDEVQLCAQAFCLEEMLGIGIDSGAIFYAQSQRRTEVVFDATLRGRTLQAIASLRALLTGGVLPIAELKPQCAGCFLHEVCLPEAAGRKDPALFEPHSYP